MRATRGWQGLGVMALGVSMALTATVRAQERGFVAPDDLPESILTAKERAFGEPFDPAIRASLKSRMSRLSLEQLAVLSGQGAEANLEAALGSVTSDLVYTPVTPCRVFDSRVSAGGPGPIAANSQWNVFVAGAAAPFAAQGGAAGGCGVPVGSTSAIINFVTVLPAGPGNIRAWAVANPQPVAPLAAILNYGAVAGLPAIANGVAVPLCNPAATSCTLGDLRLQADTNATNILGDVVGYFGPAVGGFVDLTTDQTVGGNKIFSSPIVGSVTGSAASVTGIVPISNGGTGSSTQNFVDLTTAQTVGGDKTFTGNLVLSPSTATAGTIMKGVNRFIHDSGSAGGNTFVGELSGNFVLTGNNNTGIGRGTLTADTSGSSNTALGEGALNRNTSGITNTAAGRNALFFNTTGGFNSALGAGALQNNATGSSNTASGRSALFANTVGSANTASGASALAANTSGVGNTADGMSALGANTIGNSNTAVGQLAMSVNLGGSFNTAVGIGALSANTTGAGNIALGSNAGQSLTTGSNNIDIGNPGSAAESNTIRIGTSGTHTVTFLAGVSGVTVAGGSVSAVVVDDLGQLGTGPAPTPVNFSGSLSGEVTGTQGATVVSNAVSTNTALALVRRDGSGAFAAGSAALDGDLALVTPSTAAAGSITKGGVRFIHNFGANNTFVGLGAGNFSMSGGANLGLGPNALQNNSTGDGNTATGSQALAANTSGTLNTASGLNALQANTSGSFNTANGASALLGNTVGINNTAVGVSALRNNTTAGQNVAIGTDALRTQSYPDVGNYVSLNTAVGYQALFSNQPTATTNGGSNTAAGGNALRGNTTGNQNTAVGAGALLTNTVGTGNTAIGAGADVSANNLSNATAIGGGASVDASNKIRLGNSLVTLIEGQVAYTFASDRTKKENFREVDAGAVLGKLRELGVTSWNYIGNDPKAFRHYGPMAQDFYAAFGRDEVGAIGTDTTINSGDLAGILMLGLKGLDAQVRKDREIIDAQAAHIAELEERTARLTARLEGLVLRLASSGAASTEKGPLR